ncbi:hypothetical protein VTH06DRAFT_2005 [Thermothelomyces fergusii]
MGAKATSAPADASSAAAGQGAQEARWRLRTYHDKLFSSFAMYPFPTPSFSALFRREDTRARRPPEEPRNTTESHEAPGSQLGDAGLPQSDPAPDRLGEDSNSYSLLRGSSGATTGATPHRSYSPATFSTGAYLQDPDLASFTSPECEPRGGQEVGAQDECSVSSCEPSADGKERASRVAPADAVRPAFLHQKAHLECAARPASGVSAAKSAQEKGNERVCEGAAAESGGYFDKGNQGSVHGEGCSSGAKGRASSSGLPRDITPAVPLKTPRSRAVKPYTTSAGYRTWLAARASRKTGYCRALNNSRASLRARTPPSPPVKTAPVPDENAAVDPRRLRQGGNKNHCPGSYQIPTPATTVLHPATNGFPETGAAGDVAEQSLGPSDPPFAKNGGGNASGSRSSNDGGDGDHHYFFHFPPPDMGHHNRDFDRELERSRPVYDGLNTDLIDKQLDAFAARTELILSRLKAHQAEFEPVNTLFIAIKNELTHLNYERQRAITSQYSLLNRTTPRERARILARVAEAEKPLLEEQKRVKEVLMELVIRGRTKIARILREDLRVPATIDETRARTSRRKMMEEQYTELGIAGAMIGLRGSLKQQSYSNHTAILRFARRVVDEGLKEFDEKHSWGKPGEPVSVEPVSNVDSVVTTVPPWFAILDAKGTVKLRATGPVDRLKELLQILQTSWNAAREEEWADEFRPNRHAWKKQYHEPSDAWPNALRRKRGGWWACRSGPDASPAERSCKLCHQSAASPQGQVSTRTAREQYRRVLEEIEAAQAEASKRHQLMLKYQLQQEREDIDQYWQRREWIRSGGGVEVSKVLHGRDVGEPNYRPSSSFQASGLMPRKQTINEPTFPPAAGPSSPPRPLGRRSPLPDESLTGEAASKLGSVSGESSRPPRRLHGSPLFHELLAGKQGNEVPTQMPPPLSLHRLHSSQAHDALHGRLPSNDTSPPQGGPSQLRSSMARQGQRRKKGVSWQL